MEFVDLMLDPDAVYQDGTGATFLLAMYDSRYVYLHRTDGFEVVLEHSDFNKRVHNGNLKRIYPQPEMVFPPNVNVTKI